MRYRHTQTGPIALGLLAIAAVLGVNAWLFHGDWHLFALFSTGAACFLFLALCFHQLTIEDEGDRLALRFGPLPVFHKHIRYDAMTSVDAGRSSLIDGLGIHWVPGRGWTWNLWGADCVVVHLGSRILRIGSDDVPNLLAFLRTVIRGR